MYLLEGDFSDKLYHFGAVIERYKINTGGVRNMIKLCEGHLAKLNTVNQLYDCHGYA